MRTLPVGVAALALSAGCSGKASPIPAPQTIGEPQAIAELQAAVEQQAAGAQQAASQQSGLPLVVSNSIGMQLVLIPSGQFSMGSDEWTRAVPRPWPPPAEYPRHTVRLTKPFYLGVHEVTLEAYERVMGPNPGRAPPRGPQYPVEFASWDDAAEFCVKLSAMPEEKTANRVYRLPTEAVWEYACRAGSATRYSFGSDAAALKDYAWFHESSSDRPHPVGEKRPNAWGLYDMYGNVSEWCADWYGPYTGSLPQLSDPAAPAFQGPSQPPHGASAESSVDDPTGPAAGEQRVHRGGCCYDLASRCQSAIRSRGITMFQGVGVGFLGLPTPMGFRVVLVPPDK